MKIIYNYNRDTGEYINNSTIHKDDFGNYNLPAFSTEIEPNLEDGFKSIFDGKIWHNEEIFNFNYIINENGFINKNGNELKTNNECPNEKFYYYNFNISDWVLDLDKVKNDKLEKMKQCRSDCWQKFDGLYNACERDLKQDPTNVDLIAKLTACETLRQCLKDLPETVQTALDSSITIEDIQAIEFASCLTIPTEIAEEVNSYLTAN